ncbi:MAG: helix-turn-helix domain-containing protein [Ruminococcus sp.]|nr:helix-turn-helix domain-containing protein [Ruminococcus sp.]
MNIGKNLRILREEKGMTQTELAERLHCTQGFISMVETKNKSISIDLIFKLSKILDCSTDAIITGNRR